MLPGTEYAKATMKTLRLRLIKVAGYVKEMKTRIKIELQKQFPSKCLVISFLFLTVFIKVRYLLQFDLIIKKHIQEFPACRYIRFGVGDRWVKIQVEALPVT